MKSDRMSGIVGLFYIVAAFFIGACHKKRCFGVILRQYIYNPFCIFRRAVVESKIDNFLPFRLFLCSGRHSRLNRKVPVPGSTDLLGGLRHHIVSRFTERRHFLPDQHHFIFNGILPRIDHHTENCATDRKKYERAQNIFIQIVTLTPAPASPL